MIMLLALAGVMLAVQATAHILGYPPPFNAPNNPHRTNPPDPYLRFPYDCCGEHARWHYPCRGYHSFLGTSQGSMTATWEAGSTQSWNIGGVGNHHGGSCQKGFNTDEGTTFHATTSYEGKCPHRNAGVGPEVRDFAFTVPRDLEAGMQIFARTWCN
ncbi:hypothetical protein B0A50_04720 [Salinomyces thailandicus]|uniref:Secreted protein n=1 Tax=Salinomyces thailandicus TaxID=706561 RepID=A0A4U0TX49_9PEZI|nr:hypothetical protein B0A50_04720 [Salinomyces thailandica]